MAINLPIVSKFDNKGVKGATGAFEGMGKKLAVLGGVVAAAFSIKAITDFSKQSILAAEKIETSGNRIDAIASSMGVFGDDIDNVTQRLKDYADTNEQLLAVDENVIMQTQAKLLTFKELAETAGEAGGSFDRATAASIDLAAAGFGAAETNAVQLGKALNDPITGLSALNRVGLTFTETEKEQIIQLQKSGDMLGAQDILLKALETQVGGTALATADASVKMGLAFGEIQETVGAALLPAFQGFTAAVLPLVTDLLPKISEVMDTKVRPALEAAVESFTALIERFRAGESIGEIVSSIFTGIGDTIDEFFKNDGFTRIGNMFAGAFDSFSELRMSLFNAITAALPGIIAGFVTFLPQIVEFITGTLIPTVLEQLSHMLTTLVELFAEVLPALVEGIAAVIPDIVQSLADLLPVLLETLLNMIPMLLETAVEVFMSLVSAVIKIVPQLIETVVSLLPKIIATVLEFLPKLLESAITIFNALITAVVTIIPDLITAIVDLIPVITKSVIDILPMLLETAVELFMALITAVTTIIPDLIDAILALMPDITQAIIDILPELTDAGIELFLGLVTATVEALPDIIEAILEMVPKMTGELLEKVPEFISAGAALLGGIAKGVLDNIGRVASNLASSIGNAITSKVKGFFGIASPSKVFAGIGGELVAGLEKGMGDGKELLARASVDMASTVTMSASDTVGAMSAGNFSTGGSGAAQSSTVMNVTINAGVGSDPVSIGREVVNAIKRYESVSGKVFASV